MKQRKLLSVQAKPETSAIRTQSFKGSDHLIIPMVILVEGVLTPSNASGPELALATEFGKFPEGWNGRPVLLNHPTINGEPTSASVPEIAEKQVFGQLFNTKLEDNKLKSEAWIDMSRLNTIGGEAAELIGKIQNGDLVAEVSTGLFMVLEESEGVYKGEKFIGIWREVVPDHLAVLSEGTIGACSVDDGCGTPRTNTARVLCDGAASCNCKGAAMNLSKAEKDMEESIFKTLMQKMRNLMGFRDNRDLSHRDIGAAILSALAAEDPNNFFYVVATYSDRFVYVVGWDETLFQRSFQINEDDSITLGSEKVQVRPVTDFVPVMVKADASVEANSSTAAATTTNSGTQEEDKMKTKEQRVQALIENKANNFTEADKGWLTALEDGQLEKIETIKDEEDSEEVVVTEPATTATTEAPVANAAKSVTAEQYVAEAPAEVRELLQEGLRMQAEKRKRMIEGIKANSSFTDAELSGFNSEQLEKMHSAVVRPHFLGAGAGGLGSVKANAEATSDRFADPMPPLVVPQTETK